MFLSKNVVINVVVVSTKWTWFD